MGFNYVHVKYIGRSSFVLILHQLGIVKEAKITNLALAIQECNLDKDTMAMESILAQQPTTPN
jgi:hypothetical protein